MHLDFENDCGGVGDGVTDNTTALQDVIDNLTGPAKITFAAGKTFVISGNVKINKPVVTFAGEGAKLILGANLAPGAHTLEIEADRFRAYGFECVDGGTKAKAFSVVPKTESIKDFKFFDMVFSGFHYSVRIVGQSDKLVKDVRIRDCESTAPGGQPASHFFGQYVDGYHVTGCTTYLGTNSSQIGAADAKNVQIIGNRCFGNEGLDLGNADAAIQIEDCPGCNAVISSNICDHDIWVDDSTKVTIGPNIARRLRFTVTERNNTSINCSGGIYNRITIDSFSTPGAFRTHATFGDIQLTCTDEDYGIYADGNYVGRVVFDRIQYSSNAAVANVHLTKASGASYRFTNSQFLTGAKNVYGSGGTLVVSDCENWSV